MGFDDDRDPEFELEAELYVRAGSLEHAAVAESAPADDSDLGQDDFAALLVDRAEAQNKDGHLVDDLATEKRFRDIKRERANLHAPRVRTIPGTVDEAVLGAELSVVGGVPPVPAVFWNGETDESTLVCVTLANSGRINGGWPTAQSAAALPFAYRPFARVIAGSRAGFVTFDVDINRGCQFKIGCSSITVQLGIDAAPSGFANATMLLSANLAFNGPSVRVHNTRTAYIDSLANAGTSTIVIPNFAQSLLPLQRTDLASAVLLQVRDTNSTVIQARALTAGQVMTEEMPIADDAYDILVTNQGPNTSTFRLCFGLSL